MESNEVRPKEAGLRYFQGLIPSDLLLAKAPFKVSRTSLNAATVWGTSAWQMSLWRMFVFKFWIPGCFAFKIQLWMFGLCLCILLMVEAPWRWDEADPWQRSFATGRSTCWPGAHCGELASHVWWLSCLCLPGAPPHPAWSCLVYTASRTWPAIQCGNDGIKDELEISSVNLFFT